MGGHETDDADTDGSDTDPDPPDRGFGEHATAGDEPAGQAADRAELGRDARHLTTLAVATLLLSVVPVVALAVPVIGFFVRHLLFRAGLGLAVVGGVVAGLAGVAGHLEAERRAARERLHAVTPARSATQDDRWLRDTVDAVAALGASGFVAGLVLMLLETIEVSIWWL